MTQPPADRLEKGHHVASGAIETWELRTHRPGTWTECHCDRVVRGHSRRTFVPVGCWRYLAALRPMFHRASRFRWRLGAKPGSGRQQTKLSPKRALLDTNQSLAMLPSASLAGEPRKRLITLSSQPLPGRDAISATVLLHTCPIHKGASDSHRSRPYLKRSGSQNVCVCQLWRS